MNGEVNKLYKKWEMIYSELLEEAKKYYVWDKPFEGSVESYGSIRDYVREKNNHLINYPSMDEKVNKMHLKELADIIIDTYKRNEALNTVERCILSNYYQEMGQHKLYFSILGQAIVEDMFRMSSFPNEKVVFNHLIELAEAFRSTKEYEIYAESMCYMALDYASRAKLNVEENYAKAVLANIYITLEGANSLKAQMIFEQLPKTKDALCVVHADERYLNGYWRILSLLAKKLEQPTEKFYCYVLSECVKSFEGFRIEQGEVYQRENKTRYSCNYIIHKLQSTGKAINEMLNGLNI